MAGIFRRTVIVSTSSVSGIMSSGARSAVAYPRRAKWSRSRASVSGSQETYTKVGALMRAIASRAAGETPRRGGFITITSNSVFAAASWLSTSATSPVRISMFVRPWLSAAARALFVAGGKDSTIVTLHLAWASASAIAPEPPYRSSTFVGPPLAGLSCAICPRIAEWTRAACARCACTNEPNDAMWYVSPMRSSACGRPSSTSVSGPRICGASASWKFTATPSTFGSSGRSARPASRRSSREGARSRWSTRVTSTPLPSSAPSRGFARRTSRRSTARSTPPATGS